MRIFSSNRSGSSLSARQPLRVGFIGAGYIADFHARAVQDCEGVELVSVFDAHATSASSFAARWRGVSAYPSLEAMLNDAELDAVHVLTPADRHHGLALEALRKSKSVFIEKPMCASPSEAGELAAAAQDAGCCLGVNHNFLFSQSFQLLLNAVRAGDLGPIEHVSIVWFSDLPQISAGPFDAWMLRAPANLLLETGSHLISALLMLVGQPDALRLDVDRETHLPNGRRVFRRWRLSGLAGRTSFELLINHSPGVSRRAIFAKGVFGSATLDWDADTCAFDLPDPMNPDLARFQRTRRHAGQTVSQGRRVLRDVVLGKARVRGRGNPYEMTFSRAIHSFYHSLRNNVPIDLRLSANLGQQVADQCARATASDEGSFTFQAPPSEHVPASPRMPSGSAVLVVGGSGFIGRALVRELIGEGHRVRIMARSATELFDGMDPDKLELFRGDARVPGDIQAALSGVEVVYHLANAAGKTWEESVQNVVSPARVIAEACISSGVRRLVYTGTIDSYYTGKAGSIITEATPLDPYIHRRNYYARAKAEAERLLIELYRAKGLPVVILRPGIVIGSGGTPFHWGVGRFTDNVCEVWGQGDHPLPFVLVDDVAAALKLAYHLPDLEGRTYNLVDSPLLSARDYLRELQAISGIKLRVHYRSTAHYYLADLAKWSAKVVTRHPDRFRIPSYRDWDSRAHRAVFDCTLARTELGWVPASHLKGLVSDGIGRSVETWMKHLS